MAWVWVGEEGPELFPLPDSGSITIISPPWDEPLERDD